jgi:hypothetical protein
MPLTRGIAQRRSHLFNHRNGINVWPNLLMTFPRYFFLAALLLAVASRAAAGTAHVDLDALEEVTRPPFPLPPKQLPSPSCFLCQHHFCTLIYLVPTGTSLQ